MTKHTPAPWRARLDKPTGQFGIMIENENSNIANVYLMESDTAWGKCNYIERPENKEALANAHLIAAAPEMLEALRAVKVACLGLPIPCEVQKQVLEAINKAKGAE